MTNDEAANFLNKIFGSSATQLTIYAHDLLIQDNIRLYLGALSTLEHIDRQSSYRSENIYPGLRSKVAADIELSRARILERYIFLDAENRRDRLQSQAHRQNIWVAVFGIVVAFFAAITTAFTLKASLTQNELMAQSNEIAKKNTCKD